MLSDVQVFHAYAEEASGNDAVQKKRKNLLENSLLWRICEVSRLGTCGADLQDTRLTSSDPPKAQLHSESGLTFCIFVH